MQLTRFPGAIAANESISLTLFQPELGSRENLDALSFSLGLGLCRTGRLLAAGDCNVDAIDIKLARGSS